MPVPKKKTSRSKRNTRRSHDALSRVGMIICSQCGEKKLLHRICPSCGTYRGRKTVSTEKE